MAKLSVCVEMIFREVGFLDRLPKVREAGFDAFEFWGTSGKDLAEIRRRQQDNGLAVSALCAEHGSSLVSAGSAVRQEFLDGVRRALEACDLLDCRTVIVTVGNEDASRPRAEQHANVVAHLAAAAPLAEKAGRTLVLEPLNILVDHKGYYLATTAEGVEMINEVGHPAVKLLYDIYHQQITEGNLIANLREHIGRIGHFHSADVPGRHEFGTGEINYANVLAEIDKLGYRGYVGLEFGPSASSAEALARCRRIAGLG